MIIHTLHLSLWQVRIGMDLTKIVLPTFILERRSLLEMFADFFAHPDLFVRYVVCSVQCRNHAARMLLTPNISICVMRLWWNQVMSWRTQSNWGNTHAVLQFSQPQMLYINDICRLMLSPHKIWTYIFCPLNCCVQISCHWFTQNWAISYLFWICFVVLVTIRHQKREWLR